MPRDGSGNYTRTNLTNTGATTWQLDATQGTNILSTRHDNHDQDIAAAITQSVSKDGQTPLVANLPFSGFKVTNIGAATLRTDAPQVAQVQDGALLWGGTSSGALNTYSVVLSPVISAYSSGQSFSFISHQANTGPATININGVGSVALKRGNGLTALTSGDIILGQVVQVMYVPTGGGVFQLLETASVVLPNGVYVQGTNASGTGNVPTIGVDTNNNTVVPNGIYLPNNAPVNFYNLAGTGAALQEYTLPNNNAVITATGDLNLAGNTVTLKTGGSNRITFDTAGNMIPAVDNTIQIGNGGGNLSAIFTKSIQGMAFTDWVPTFSIYGASTVSSIVVTYARYMLIGKLLILQVKASYTVGGTINSQFMSFSTPVSVSASYFGHGVGTDGGQTVTGVADSSGFSKVTYSFNNGTAYYAGNHTFIFAGIFEAA